MDIFSYSFVVRALEAGVLIGIVAPLVGLFLVLRRFSLIADTLSHVSFAGVALGGLLGLNPLLTATGATLLSSFALEKLRASKKVYGESILSLFLSGSLAAAVLLIGLAKGGSISLSNYLFGSIVTVRTEDIYLISCLAVVVIAMIFFLWKELQIMAFDEEAAEVMGIKVKSISLLFMVVTALTVSASIPVVGILLVSALMVLPVLTALQLRLSFKKTALFAVLFSVLSVVLGIVISVSLNLAAGGVIVMLNLLFFGGALASRRTS